MKRRHANGFTLLEIMVVLFLISLIAMIIVPRLSFSPSSPISQVTRNLVREFKILHWEAISTQNMVRLDFDLDRRRISASFLDPSGTIKPFERSGVRDFFLPKKISIRQVDVLHQGKVTDGRTFIQFFPSGSVEPTRIYLDDENGRSMTIIIRPLTGRILVKNGRVHGKITPPAFYGPPSGELPSLEDNGED
jgi:general secretion pathway protein H